GPVSFARTCRPVMKKDFERAVALLHSFAYASAEAAFRHVAATDPQCAIAYWGIAMSSFQQLWDPPLRPGGFETARREIRRAGQVGAPSDRERGFIDALARIYDPAVAYRQRVIDYEGAMGSLAAAYPRDVEAQVFYALALLAAASPWDKTHVRQKRALEILEPLYEKYPEHPGIAHYLIHACDNAELA